MIKHINNLTFESFHVDDIKPNSLLLTYILNTTYNSIISPSKIINQKLDLFTIELILNIERRYTGISPINDPLAYFNCIILYSNNNIFDIGSLKNHKLANAVFHWNNSTDYSGLTYLYQIIHL